MMKYILGKFFKEEKVDPAKIPDEEVTRRLRRPRPSVSFSVAYSRVCEWASGKTDSIPTIEEFEMAEKWAKDIGDDWLLEQTVAGRAARIERETKTTPRPFPRPHVQSGTYAKQVVEEVPARVFKKDSRWEGDEPDPENEPTTRRITLLKSG